MPKYMVTAQLKIKATYGAVFSQTHSTVCAPTISLCLKMFSHTRLRVKLCRLEFGSTEVTKQFRRTTCGAHSSLHTLHKLPKTLGLCSLANIVVCCKLTAQRGLIIPTPKMLMVPTIFITMLPTGSPMESGTTTLLHLPKQLPTSISTANLKTHGF